MSGVGDPSLRAASDSLVLAEATALPRRGAGPVALIVEAGGPSGAAMEARLGADGAIRCERACDVEQAGPLAGACGATVILLLPPAGGERFEVLGALHANDATAGLPIVVIDEIGGTQDRRNAFAAGADDYWQGWPDPSEARARLFALSRGVMAERQRDEALKELVNLRARLADANSRLAKGQDLDEATGLPTRRRLMEQLEVEWRRARRGGGPLSLVLVEVGRPGGGPRTPDDEQRLVRVSAALRAVLRRGGDLLGALLGEPAGRGLARDRSRRRRRRGPGPAQCRAGHRSQLALHHRHRDRAPARICRRGPQQSHRRGRRQLDPRPSVKMGRRGARCGSPLR